MSYVTHLDFNSTLAKTFYMSRTRVRRNMKFVACNQCKRGFQTVRAFPLKKKQKQSGLKDLLLFLRTIIFDIVSAFRGSNFAFSLHCLASPFFMFQKRHLTTCMPFDG